jgi:hypothetical protein
VQPTQQVFSDYPQQSAPPCLASCYAVEIKILERGRSAAVFDWNRELEVAKRQVAELDDKVTGFREKLGRNVDDPNAVVSTFKPDHAV